MRLILAKERSFTNAATLDGEEHNLTQSGHRTTPLAAVRLNKREFNIKRWLRRSDYGLQHQD